MSCCCPLVPWLQVALGPFEFRRCMPVGKERGKGMAQACSPEGDCALGPMSWELLPLLVGRILRGGLVRGSHWNSHQFPMCGFSGLWSLLMDWCQSRSSLVTCSWSWCQPWCHLSDFAAFLVLELKYNWGLHVIFREERLGCLNCTISSMLGEERLPWG